MNIIHKNAYLIRSILVYIVEAFITLNYKVQYKHMSPFSSMLLVCTHLFFFINFSYIGCLIS